jgi:hypothetical protein
MRIVIGLVVAIALAVAGYSWVVLHWSYSTSERAGWLQYPGTYSIAGAIAKPKPRRRDEEVKSTTTWLQFTKAMPDLASFGKQRLEGRIAYLATVRPDGSPRVHPVSPFLSRNDLFVYMEPTAPKRDTFCSN